jgi:spore maturation protein CgeB
MADDNLSFVFLGLSITSSWGNGHATTYRGLVQELTAQGHDVLFLERDVPWYAQNRDLPNPDFCDLRLYQDLDELRDLYTEAARDADLVVVGSYVPEGVAVSDWVNAEAGGLAAFYDIDTPITLAKLKMGDYEYLAPHQIPQFDLYLSFTGGRTLQVLENEYGAPAARALYCSVDPSLYYPNPGDTKWDMGYMGTYSSDRQPRLSTLLLQPARQWLAGRFVIAGPQYPDDIRWPPNIQRIEHLPPAEHCDFYNAQRFTLNITRDDMIRAGYAPSVRLFEAAACGVPIISDNWEGLETFFAVGTEILVASHPSDTMLYLSGMPEQTRRRIGERARMRVLAEHTAAHRAAELVGYVRERQSAMRPKTMALS